MDSSSWLDAIRVLLRSTGLSHLTLGSLFMIAVGCLLIYLGIRRRYEPLLLIPIGAGAILANIPVAGLMEEGGLLYYLYAVGIKTGVFPLLIFLGVGALTDFKPLLANPMTALLGAAAQIGIFGSMVGALALRYLPGPFAIEFDLREAASIGIIGGADGPTSIYLSSQLAIHLLGPVAIAAYSYMAMVPIIQPPIMRLLTSERERRVRMTQLRPVSRREEIWFPLGVILLTALLVPSATPLIGMLMFGNLLRVAGVVERLSKTAQNELINTVTIFLGLSVGATLLAEQFLTLETLGILVLGIIAFGIGTAGGVLLGKLMCRLSGWRINPLIGSAGVSAVPMAARVSETEGLRADPENHLLMHAMGPNVAGVIGSAVAAGVLLALLG